MCPERMTVTRTKEDTEVNKKPLALEKKKHHTINHAVQNDIISSLNNDRKTQLS
jgi:hypothetical protein